MVLLSSRFLSVCLSVWPSVWQISHHTPTTATSLAGGRAGATSTVPYDTILFKHRPVHRALTHSLTRV
ncbi:hypothetical protein L873DRAFT_1822501 [Choiromyces venosus 120613-1]|uniref:Secreted protein n=1 Tax=Choiromyces venosus 120613-1 TaxID=1336337 RepID=A0A3N4IXC7_9PEZI|nr:hypothetical protein L873DRAFT_1822501 [Choiromyces venosus 120613-1]